MAKIIRFVIYQYLWIQYKNNCYLIIGNRIGHIEKDQNEQETIKKLFHISIKVKSLGKFDKTMNQLLLNLWIELKWKSFE